MAVFDRKEDARDYLAGKFSGQVIGLGDSMTLDSMGLADALSRNNTVWDYLAQGDPETSKEAMQRISISTSANAVAETGEIINIDGSGNRVALDTFRKKRSVFCNRDEQAGRIVRRGAVARPKYCRTEKRATLWHETRAPSKQINAMTANSPDRICMGLVVLWAK